MAEVPSHTGLDSPPEAQDETPLTAEPGLREAAAPATPTRRADQIAQAVIVTLLFAVPALISVHSVGPSDPDVWWHLRTGEWILQHHAVPHVDPFSATGAGKPWQAYSWLFEVFIFQLFQRFGMVGLVGYSAGMVLAIAVAMRHLARRLQIDFSNVALLTLIACFLMNRLYTPRPWLFSILFFVLELDILMHARKTGRLRELAWLPVIFALWSNTHIQFIYGLAILGCAAVEAVAAYRGIGVKTRLRAPWVFAALAGSALATWANPYGWHIYRIVYDLATQPGGLDKISELQAIPFRQLTDFGVLFLAIAATAALAWGRRFRMFETALLVFAVMVSFRSQRDIWVLVTVAAAILASTIPGRKTAVDRLPGWATTLSVVAASLLVWGGFRVLHVNNATLRAGVAKVLPIDAVNEVRAKGYSGPLYNDFNWGGYLIWALRMPVSIDGRGGFYGDKSLDRSVATWSAAPDWDSDPTLKSAGLVLGPVQAPLVQILRMDPNFQLVYEDKLAAVFVARKRP